MLERAVCVYCASSTSAHPEYREAAFRMGEVLAGRGITLIYGGGSRGSMGALADGALSKGGRVVGVLPRFMVNLEWGHRGLSELKLVEDMQHSERSHIENNRRRQSRNPTRKCRDDRTRGIVIRGDSEFTRCL